MNGYVRGAGRNAVIDIATVGEVGTLVIQWCVVVVSHRGRADGDPYLAGLVAHFSTISDPLGDAPSALPACTWNW